MYFSRSGEVIFFVSDLLSDPDDTEHDKFTDLLFFDSGSKTIHFSLKIHCMLLGIGFDDDRNVESSRSQIRLFLNIYTLSKHYLNWRIIIYMRHLWIFTLNYYDLSNYYLNSGWLNHSITDYRITHQFLYSIIIYSHITYCCDFEYEIRYIEFLGRNNYNAN